MTRLTELSQPFLQIFSATDYKKNLLNLLATEGGFGTQIKSVESADKRFAV